MTRTSRQYSRLLIVGAISDTSSLRNPQPNRLCDSSSTHEEESLTVYTDGFRAYDPIEDDEDFHRECSVERKKATVLNW